MNEWMNEWAHVQILCDLSSFNQQPTFPNWKRVTLEIVSYVWELCMFRAKPTSQFHRKDKLWECPWNQTRTKKFWFIDKNFTVGSNDTNNQLDKFRDIIQLVQVCQLSFSLLGSPITDFHFANELIMHFAWLQSSILSPGFHILATSYFFKLSNWNEFWIQSRQKEWHAFFQKMVSSLFKVLARNFCYWKIYSEFHVRKTRLPQPNSWLAFKEGTAAVRFFIACSFRHTRIAQYAHGKHALPLYVSFPFYKSSFDRPHGEHMLNWTME